MRYRPSKRVIWLAIPLIPVLLMCGGVWLAGTFDEPDISTWGSKPPAAGARSKPLGWYDDSLFSLAHSKLNPWKSEMGHDFGSHFYNLKQSENPQDQEKYRKLMKLGKAWYGRILVRYPELSVTYKDLPAERNGLLQWARFEKRLRDTIKPGASGLIDLPDKLKAHFGVTKEFPWNSHSVKDWLDDNRALLDEARAIALMPERSSGGFSEDETVLETGMAARDFSKAFLMEARLFAEQGDIGRALESIRAANGLADHLRNGEAPTFMQGLVGANVQQTIDRYVLSNILPALPSGTDVTAWENAANPTLRQPADFARLVRGEWNAYMPGVFLPALADTKDPGTPADAEALAEAYTQASRSFVNRNESLSLSDLPSNPVVRPGYKDLSLRSQRIAKEHGMTTDSHNLRDTWERYQVQTGMTQAAFAILKGQPVPNDPIYGAPYQWDPVTRKLSLPKIQEFKKSAIKPLILPTL
ncbi:hypothetical protein JIN84_17675 [Luteolibacter yonseiensis]|uniref:Uncharacterized protein n=1 Tax=Luteolibacter yonseiensis TaxID=1144680 RepID=A0A934R5Q6_9BACT|nr:hypothetical protein [Luteolibacter yonseiensis]MBK1817454.1 hypothetical protein [Luteolibacter yonseiensis]